MKTKNTPTDSQREASVASYKDVALARARDKMIEDADRADLLSWAKDNNVGIVHINTNFENRGGMTIAYRKTTEFESGCMVTVAVNVCSDSDSFSKKIGAAGALRKFADGEIIELPLLRLFVKEDLAYAVKQSFTALYRAY